MHAHRDILVYTEKDLCRVCYTCVRECPVKAIRILNGQAEIISERCIGCGNCVKVCSQKAKRYLDTTDKVLSLLQSAPPRIALLAPSFPAEFIELDDPGILVGMIRKLGFDLVIEVGFGADMVASEYEMLLGDAAAGPTISSDCPAIVQYIEQYFPHLVPYLAPVVSPMLAATRLMRKRYGSAPVVFIGPCIAKKLETDEVDEVITFTELRSLFAREGISPETATISEFDPPRARKGAIFPVSRGLLQTMNRTEDIVQGDLIVAEGRVHFREAIKEFEADALGKQHLEVLCCEGCVMGPGMSPGTKRLARMRKVTSYVRAKMNGGFKGTWEDELGDDELIDLSQHFEARDRRSGTPDEEAIQTILNGMGKHDARDHLNCGACGYDTCYEHAQAVAQGLAENEMCLPFAIETLHRSVQELHISNESLANAREALRQSEKLAHMGQLSAGIAHELNNPLGVITMYANILLEETAGNAALRDDLQLIVDQTQRCRKIVGGLLNFARKTQVNLEELALPELIDQSIAALVVPPGVSLKISNKLQDPMIQLDRDQMLQVLTNLIRNATEAMPEGGTVHILMEESKEATLKITVEDTGSGIPPAHLDKIFTPFFTTKGPGKGTGLGLPIAYGIVKMHRGKISIVSHHDPAEGPTGTRFIIELPRQPLQKQENA